MRPQPEINNLLDQFIGQYAGTRPDYWGWAGECLSTVKRWVDVVRNGHLNGVMQAPNSTDGWGSGYWIQPPQLITELFDKQAYDPNAHYPAGSLFVNVRSHHIGILLDNQPGDVAALVFESNADPDGSAAHSGLRDKSRIDGILVLRVAPPPPRITRQITDFSSPIQYVVGTGHHKWNLAYDDFSSVKDNPVDMAGDNRIITAVAVLQHSAFPQYQYYLENRNVLQGWNALDCAPYTPPPKPYVPPAPPVTVPGVTYYEVLPDVIKYYDTAADAKQDRNAKGVKAKGNYIELMRDGMAIKLVKSNSEVRGDFWINNFDNVLPRPVPSQPVDVVTPANEPVDPPAPTSPVEPPASAPKLQFELIQPVMLTADLDAPRTFPDLENPKNPNIISLTPGKAIEYSMRTRKDGNTYYIPMFSMKRGWRHGVPETVLRDTSAHAPVLDYNRDGRTDLKDPVDAWMDFLEYGSKHFRTVTEKATKFAATGGRKFIDGISKRSK